MDRQDVLKRLLYPKCKSAIEFQFDSLIANPLLSYITIQDIAQLNKVATSLKYSSKPKEKYAMIDSIMTNRGFRKMASGTNRVTYRYLNDYSIVIKIAIDKVGLSDNWNEYKNQQLLKPFVTKCFEVSPCGTVGLFERVVPITSREEFVYISDDIFDLINNLIGKYVLEDIGEKFYMNYGLREGFGPVLLDYPYVFELDGRKLICNVPDPLEPKGYCGGEIDYDVGYNDLVCKKCGKRYLATDLKSDESSSDKPKIIVEGDDIIMKCRLVRGDEVISELNSQEHISTNTIKSKRDFVNLKAKVATAEQKVEENYKPKIKRNDEVTLVARLRGRRTGKDVDKEVREKEENLARTAQTIPVSFEPDPIPARFNTVSHLEVSPLGQVTETIETVCENGVDAAPTVEAEPAEKPNRYYITDDGEIWDFEDDVLIGYTVKETNKRIMEAVETTTEPDRDLTKDDVKEDHVMSIQEYEEVTSITADPNPEVAIYSKKETYTTTIGDILGSKLDAFKGNDSYKTASVVAPIDSLFSKPEESKSVPELIIHPRKDNTGQEMINEY